MRTRARHRAAAQPLPNGHSDVRETAEEVMQTIEIGRSCSLDSPGARHASPTTRNGGSLLSKNSQTITSCSNYWPLISCREPAMMAEIGTSPIGQ
jgi:hypothetical protein